MNARIGPVAGEPMRCADARQLVHELALGTLAGDQRARLLEHIERCPACEGLAADLAGVVDSLLLLTPEADPPPGFESAVLARIAADDRRPTPRRPRRLRLRTLVVAAAAAVVLVAGTAAVTVSVRGDGGGPGEVTLPVATGQLRTGALIGGNGYAWGQAYLFTGKTSWVFIDMKWDVPNGSYSIMLDRTDGPSLAMSGLHLVDGEGSFGHTVGASADVSGVRVVDDGGHTICRARLTVTRV